MTGVIPPTGASSPCENGPGLPPALAGSLQFGAPIVGVASPLIGASGRRPAGVALRLGSSGDDVFEIALVDEVGGTLMRIGEFETDEVVAAWRGFGGASGYPLVTQGEDGELQYPYPQLGRVRLGRIRIRRRHGLLNGRRPRFLTRRKTGRLARRPVVHHGREIIDGSRA
jgi:hypothetical protein